MVRIPGQPVLSIVGTIAIWVGIAIYVLVRINKNKQTGDNEKR